MKKLPSEELNQPEFATIGESTLQSLLNDTFAASKKVVIVDEHTHDFCLEYLLTSVTGLEQAEVVLLPAGEENKVLEVCFQVWEALSEYQIGRNDLIINLGGGVVTDMGGFIASVFKRGVHFINIPTSLLAMVDASIGGKTGIDLGPFKNQLGTFSWPVHTIIDNSFLHTLPQTELINGAAEMLKHALVADEKMWVYFEGLSEMSVETLSPLIESSVRIKSSIVNRDPLEKGDRKLLNFGHTVGHAIEGYFLQIGQPVRHGFAVAMGCIAEAYISHKQLGLSSSELNKVTQLMNRFFPLDTLLDFDKDQVVFLMKNDKKNAENKIHCTLLSKIGQGSLNHPIEEALIVESIDFLVREVKL